MIEAGLRPTAQQVAANVQTLEAHSGQLTAHEQQLAAQKGNIQTNQQDIAALQRKIGQNIGDIEETTNRFTALADYDVKSDANVNFDVGSTDISEQDQEGLKRLAQTATSLTGYILEVTGYADSTGSPTMNTKLNEDRAKAVITFLMQQCNIPVRHIVAPCAMGEYGPAASNERRGGPRTAACIIRGWNVTATS